MTLKDQIASDLKDTLREKNETKISVLRLLMGAIKNKELEKRAKLSKIGVLPEELEKQSVLSDEETLDVILSEVKKRKESIESFRAGAREDLAKKESQELEILSAYAPKPLSETEVKEIVKQKISALGIKDIKEMGKLMGAIMLEHKGKVDGNALKKFIEAELSNGT